MANASLIQPIGPWIDWNTTVSGFSVDPPIVTSGYFMTGNLCTFILYQNSGTSSSALFTFLLPFNSKKFMEVLCTVNNNSTITTGKARLSANSNVVDLIATVASNTVGGFVATGNKYVRIQVTFPVA